MSSIDLIVRPLAESSNPECVVPHIDGDDLTDLVRDFEELEGYERPGGYDGIVPAYFRFGPLMPYFLGAPDSGYCPSLQPRVSPSSPRRTLREPSSRSRTGSN